MDLVTAGQLALDTALAEWRRRIVDPPRRTWEDSAWTPSRVRIDGYIRGAMGLNWGRCSPTVAAYRRDGDFEWCGAFASWAWRHAGLDPELAEVYWSSTYRLDRYARRLRAFPTPRNFRLAARLDGAGRLYLPFDGATTYEDLERFAPRAGDVLIVNGRGYGQHITLVERWDAELGAMHTVEGNATGRGPDGTIYQGVVRQLRRWSSFRRLIRPALSDLTGAAT